MRKLACTYFTLNLSNWGMKGMSHLLLNWKDEQILPQGWVCKFSRVNANFFQACTDKALLQGRMPHPQCSLGYTFPHIYCVCRHVPLFLLHLAHFCLSPPHIRGLKVISLATASEGEDPNFKENLSQIIPFGMCRGGLKDK